MTKPSIIKAINVFDFLEMICHRHKSSSFILPKSTIFSLAHNRVHLDDFDLGFDRK